MRNKGFGWIVSVFILAIVVIVISFSWYFISQVSGSYESLASSIGLNFWGFVSVVVLIAAAILIDHIVSKNKKE